MRKLDKKLENQIRKVLTDACENTLKGYEGFQWVTHSVNFSSFPQSLKIVCVFDTNQSRANFFEGQGQQQIAATLHKAFAEVGIQLKSVDKHVSYDTQQNGARC
ncbi:Fis family transcriptional regulator [uncultured Vibrio sp.]|uniref:Fis family transcriptional regulator n=1 Tax=uncultured Vibrio sp. TaxID=114054 RepID=UPI002613632E|nr:Fis family transcriptional regulator [uncultured Vibrio sp.]